MRDHYPRTFHMHCVMYRTVYLLLDALCIHYQSPLHRKVDAFYQPQLRLYFRTNKVDPSRVPAIGVMLLVTKTMWSITK